MTQKTQDEIFLQYVVENLVDHPEDIKLTRKVDEMGVLLTLELNPEDMGKVIGRQGNTAKALRTLLRVVGVKNGSRVNLKIEDPEGYVPRSAQQKPVEEFQPTGPQGDAAMLAD